MPTDKSMPSTLKRSSQKAQRTWKRTHDNAVGQYGEGKRAHMTAYTSLKHSFEKVGDHWEEKDSKGPSDPRSESTYSNKGHEQKRTYGGVDVQGHTRKELVDRAKRAHISGYSSMNKDELGRALQKANDVATAKARE